MRSLYLSIALARFAGLSLRGVIYWPGIREVAANRESRSYCVLFVRLGDLLFPRAAALRLLRLGAGQMRAGSRVQFSALVAGDHLAGSLAMIWRPVSISEYSRRRRYPPS
jgi:hypothetical protein